MEGRGSEETSPAHRKRSVPGDFFDSETDTKRPATGLEDAMETRNSSPFVEEKKPRKRPNYLQHDDRRIIIERVARGEPQAALAREFGVTRAAVCQMYKKREKILARSGGSRTIQGPRAPTVAPQADAARKPDVKRAPGAGKLTDAPLTIQGHSKKVKLLVTTLRDPRTSPTAFRRTAARLTFILIEAALASYDSPERGSAGRDGPGVQHVEFCAITLGDESASFLTAFGQVDPDAPTGQIHVNAVQVNGSTSWKLHYLDVPDNITHVEVLLFSTSGNGGAESKAIEVGKHCF
ncbi:hypothetical protein ON010_g2707 [Phytophthora cinnamomi]|nr:hypothetical protein ON010_g2707 [Phytophthora cinnamomi]